MADGLKDAENTSSVLDQTKVMHSMSEDSDADLEKGRYNTNTSNDVNTGAYTDQNITSTQSSQQINLQNTEHSANPGQNWQALSMKDSDTVSKVDDKYLLIDEEGKSPPTLNKSDGDKKEKSGWSKRLHDEDGTLSTLGSFAGRSARRFGFGRKYKTEDDETFRSFSYSMEGASFAGDYDTFEVKQKYGYCAIGISIIQLFIIAVMMALCGVAPLEVNPMVGPYPDSFSYWGGKNAWLITQEFEVWRVASPVFLHAGVIHLFCNVAIQLETGAFFEREWGSGTWFLIYILSAIGSSIVSCISQPDTISVGASGALMGLFGAKLAEVFMFSCFCVERIGGSSSHGMRMEQLSGVLCSVSIISLFSLIPYVDWAGHLGGLLVGFLVGLCIFSSQIDGIFVKCLWGTAGFLGLVGLLVYTVTYMYTTMEFNPELKDVCQFYRQLYREGYECTCQYTFGEGDDYFREDDDWGN